MKPEIMTLFFTALAGLSLASAQDMTPADRIRSEYRSVPEQELSESSGLYQSDGYSLVLSYSGSNEEENQEIVSFLERAVSMELENVSHPTFDVYSDIMDPAIHSDHVDYVLFWQVYSQDIDVGIHTAEYRGALIYLTFELYHLESDTSETFIRKGTVLTLDRLVTDAVDYLSVLPISFEQR